MIVLLLGALVALGLEATGTPPGGRKRVGRQPQVVVVIAAALVAAGIDGGGTAFVVAAALVTFALLEGERLLGDRAALALMLGAGTLRLSASPSSPESLLAWIAMWAVVTAALSMRAGRDAEAETAAKAGLLGLIAVLLAGLAVALDGAPRQACLLGAVGLVLGVAPLQGIRVDLAHGAPPSAVALTAPLTLLALGPVLPGLFTVRFEVAVDVVVLLGLIAVPLLALAQTSLRRLLAVLIVGQCVLPVVAARADDPILPTLAAALGAIALAASLQALPALSTSTATWEDASGQGRLHPWRAGLLIFAAAQACGLPPAFGYVVRSRLAVSLADDQPWIAAGLLFGAALSALPVVRLALFLFGKEPRPSPHQPGSVGALVALALIVGAGILGGLLSSLVAIGR